MEFANIDFTVEEEAIHENALRNATNIQHAEAALLRAIDDVDRTRLYTKFLLRSVHSYCLKFLNLTESQAYYFQTVARKARSCEALRLALENEELTVSKAARICSVLDQKNQDEWIAKARTMSKSEIEREVASVSTGKKRRGVVTPVGKDLSRVSFDADDDLLAKLKRVMDLKNSDVAQGVEAALDVYLEKHDPVKKAERSKKRSARAEVLLRDHGQCTATLADGARCKERKNLHIHHIHRRCDGGADHPDNLTTLCRFHHTNFHEYEDPTFSWPGFLHQRLGH